MSDLERVLRELARITERLRRTSGDDRTGPIEGVPAEDRSDAPDPREPERPLHRRSA